MSRRGWMWFLGCLGRAFDGTETTLAAVMRKARFWERAARLTINDRQRRRAESPARWLRPASSRRRSGRCLAKCSHDTALRDIQGLIEQGLLKKDEGGGRSTSYSLALE